MVLNAAVKSSLYLLTLAGIAASGVSLARAADAPAWKSEAGTYAIMDTSEGKIVSRLFEKEAPQTVANFVGLAEGTKEFTDPMLREKTKRRLYDGTKFHRIIPGFMMQGGDPLGTGGGGPGYTIPDEIVPDLKFDRPGRLGMARTPQPNTGGSQFFITQVPYPSLSGAYTVFGQVVEGQAIVDRVCASIGTPSGKPTKEVILTKVTIERVGAPAAPPAKKD